MWIERIIGFIFRRRHYWRGASFDEMAELYASRLMTIFAINIMNLFTAVYLYKLGYPLVFIALFYAAIYALRVPYQLLVARYVAFAGPKHSLFVGNIIRVFSMAALAFVPHYGFWAIAIFGVLQQAAVGLYAVSYLVDFSKVRHSDHSGKEIGTMQLIEKGARVISPVAGGIIASAFSPTAVVIISGALFLLSAIPLLRTVEPTPPRSRITFAGFPWRAVRASLVSEVSVGFDFAVSSFAWVTFAAVIIFAGAGDSVYSQLGLLVSIGVLASMASAWFFGKVVDRRQGDMLFVTGVISNSALHLFRAFTTTPVGVAGVNIANETMTSAYVMPFLRVLFDFADTSGHRIIYLSLGQACEALGAAIASALLALVIWLFGQAPGFQFFFIIAAGVELFLLASRRYTK